MTGLNEAEESRNEDLDFEQKINESSSPFNEAF